MTFISLGSFLNEKLIRPGVRGSGRLSLAPGASLHEMVGWTRIIHRKKKCLNLKG